MLALRPLVRLILFCGTLAGCARSSPPDKIWEKFSGEKALAHVQQLVDFGPRPPATDAIKKSREYITTQLRDFGWRVTPQPFEQQTPRGKIAFVNLIADFPAKEKQPTAIFILCSHYDTKTLDTEKFVGANDGGSSTGALLEMARVLATNPALAKKIELVFFDGEEAYENFTDTDGLYGSRFFAKQLRETNRARNFRGAVLFDMMGDASLDITLSPDSPEEMAHGIFAAADALHERDHFTYFAGSILDDHTPLNQIGIPAIDLIDFDYPPWHTPADTMDKLSAESLRIVGAVALYYLAESALAR